ncbi:MAG: glycosyltransferase [bacterium]
MKIALFTNAYLPYLSGITLSVSTQKEELEALGHKVIVVAPAYPGHKEIDPNIIRVMSIPAPYPGYRFVNPFSPFAFLRLKREKIDIIHVHQPFGVGLGARLTAKLLGVPLVYTFHTLFSRYVHNASWIPRKFSQFIVVQYLKFFCNLADTIITPSTMVMRLLRMRKIKTPIKVLPTGMRMWEFKKQMEIGTQRVEIRKKHNIPLDAKLLMCSTRISAEKNIPFLLKAFPVIKKQAPNTYFIVVGGGPKVEDYKKEAAKIDPQIIFTDRQTHAQVIDHCLAADLFVYASKTETQGLVLNEAKACGLAVVAVRGGGISDVIDNGVDGYLVPENQEIFIEHVMRLLSDDQLRQKMGQKGKEDTIARFSSEVVAKQMETIYNQLIAKQ